MEEQQENNAMNYSGITTTEKEGQEANIKQRSDLPFYDKWMEDTTPITPEQMAYIEQLCGGFSNN